MDGLQREWVCPDCMSEFITEMVVFEITTNPEDAPEDCRGHLIHQPEHCSKDHDQTCHDCPETDCCDNISPWNSLK